MQPDVVFLWCFISVEIDGEGVQIAKNPLGVEFKVHNVSVQQVVRLSVIDSGVGT